MHVDLDNNDVASRLRRLGDADGEAPYDWAEFQRRRRARPRGTKNGVPRRAALAASLVLVTSAAVAFGYYLRSSANHHEIERRANQPTLAASQCATGAVQRPSGRVRCAGTGHSGPRVAPQRAAAGIAVQRWLAALPHEPVVRRVGTRAAESGLVDQIATLDELLSAERVSGARPERLVTLERRRAQLVGSLAQFRYAELLAAASR